MREDKSYRIFAFLSDIFMFVVSFLIADNIAKEYFRHETQRFHEIIFKAECLVLFCIVILFLFFTTRFKTNGYEALYDDNHTLKGIIKALMLSYFIVAFIVFTLHYDFIGRSFFLFFFMLSMFFIPASHLISKHFYLKLKKKEGGLKKYVLIIGPSYSVRSLVKSVENEIVEKMEIIGFLTYDKMDRKSFMGYKILGQVCDIENVIANNVVDMVLVFPCFEQMEKVREVVKVSEIEGIEVFLYSDVFDLSMANMKVLEYNGMHVLKFSTTEREPYMIMVKRAIDIIGSLIFIALLSPILIVSALAIKIENRWKGSVFYTQDRCGLNGRKFRMFKFRSMVDGADKMKSELANVNEAEGPVFKMKRDPRITMIGTIIRKFSIDELPQLYNVLIGDMSLVGPRPPLPSEARRYNRWQRRRLSMKPGLTCIWQVSGRSDIPFNKWVEMDLEYIDKWSLLLDIKLLLKTIPAVITGKGAY